MKDLYYKKGFAQQSVSTMISLIVGVGVAVLVLIFVGTLGGQTFSLVEPDLNSIGNSSGSSSITVLNGTAVDLTHKSIHNASFTLSNATNTLNGSGQYLLSPGNGQVTLLNNTYNNTVMTASYDYGNLTLQDNVKTAIVSGFEALEQSGNYLPIIILATIISLVLVLVLSFGGMSGGKMNSAL